MFSKINPHKASKIYIHLNRHESGLKSTEEIWVARVGMQLLGSQKGNTIEKDQLELKL